MASKHPIERGQRYRDLSPGRFGVLGTEWIVDAIFIGTDGIQHAQLVNAGDLTQQKTLAVDVLSDRERWAGVGAPGPGGGSPGVCIQPIEFSAANVSSSVR
jgi:hypothetical protein